MGPCCATLTPGIQVTNRHKAKLQLLNSIHNKRGIILLEYTVVCTQAIGLATPDALQISQEKIKSKSKALLTFHIISACEALFATSVTFCGLVLGRFGGVTHIDPGEGALGVLAPT